MSSTERAPEPTMEDILASIRRIITDDDTGTSPAERSASTAQTEDEGLEGEADNQIIDDIARVLSSGGDAPANEDAEIMDLTGELGGLELVEDDDPEELVVAETADTGPEFVEVTEELLELDEIQPDVFEPDDAEVIETMELVETVEVEEVVDFGEPVEAAPPAEELPVPQMPPLVAPEPVAEAAPAPKLSASEEAASALERAIAALKAGQAPAAPAPVSPAPSAPAFGAPAANLSTESETPPTGVIPLPEEIPMAVPMEPMSPEPDTHPDPDAESVLEMAEPESMPETPAGEEAEFVLMDAETEMVLEEPEPESAPFWPPQAEASEPEEEPAPVEAYTPAMTAPASTNGVAAHEAGESKSLEDSIKEMLRPMLREWLNENMPRMIREELDSDAVQRGQD